MSLADEVLGNWAPIIEAFDLIPGAKGRFEVMLDGELVYSKVETKRHAERGEVSRLLQEKLGAPIHWR